MIEGFQSAGSETVNVADASSYRAGETDCALRRLFRN